MSLPAGYKASEVGVIPEDWEAVPLGDLFTFKNGLNKAKQYFGYGTPIVNYMDVYRYPALRMPMVAGRVDVNKTELDSYSVQRGDVFFTRTSETVDEIGVASAMLDEANDTVFSGFVLRARPKNADLADAFKAYAFRSEAVRQQIVSKATYTTRALTNGGALSAVFLAKPPMAEQSAIAEALSDVDRGIAAVEAVIAKKRALKTATMQALLSGTRRLPGFVWSAKPSRRKKAEFGEIPEDWDVATVADVARITTGSRNTQDRQEDGLFPFFVRSQTIERINSYSFDGEAVLTAGDGVGTGKVFHYINGKFDCHQRVYRMSNFEGVDGFFFFKVFSQKFYNRIMAMTAKSSVDSVRREMIADMQIPVPSIPEQLAIAEVLSDLDNDLEQHESKLTKLRHLKTGMMQQLLTGKIRLV